MIIDLNQLKRLGKRFGVFPISMGPPPLQIALQKPEKVFIKAPAGIEPAFTGGGYQWNDELNGYRFGNQKLFLSGDGTAVWIFKDILCRLLGLDSIQKWTSGDPEYPMGKANAFFIVYGKLTGQDLGEGETAGDNVPDGETDPNEGGGLATAENENAPPYSKQDIQKMLKGEFPADTPAGPKASMDTAIPDEEPAGEKSAGEEPSSEEPSAPMTGPPPSRLAAGTPKPGFSEAENLISTIYKKAGIDPKLKLSKRPPISMPYDDIIDLYKRAKKMSPEERDKVVAFLKSGEIRPVEEGKIAKHQLDALLEHIVNGIVDEVEKAKQKAKNKKKVSKPVSRPAGKSLSKSPDHSQEPPEHSQMDWEPSAEEPPYIRGEFPEKTDYKQWVVQVANKLWKDPTDIWGGKGGRVSWEVMEVIPRESGVYYQLGKERTVHLRRTFVRRNNKWYYLNPDPRNRHWVELGKEHPMDEPSIEQEGKQSKKKKRDAERQRMADDAEYMGDADLAKRPRYPKEKSPTEKPIDEMTTTGGGNGTSMGTTGYMVPGAFSDKLSHRKDHIEVLGYKMTPQGEKEYNTSADKLYESIKKNITTMLHENPVAGKQRYQNASPQVITNKSMKKQAFQRLNENVFKLTEDNYSTEELQAMWQEDERGEYIQINDKYGTWYVAHGKAMEQIAPKDTGDYKFRLINIWCKNKNFYPNIWYVNERGNVELVSRSGQFMGGLV